MLQDTDWLLLSGNNLGSLNKVPDYLKNITLLDLSSSYITEIDETLMKVIVRSVKHLDIRGNNLKEIPQTITKANNITKLWISNNPYECNCDMMWMKDWLIDAENVTDKKNVTCSSNKIKGKINYIVCIKLYCIKTGKDDPLTYCSISMVKELDVQFVTM